MRHLDWTEIADMTAQLASRLRPWGPFDGLVAVTRGGMVPAALLAQLLDIRMIDTFCLTSYQGQEQGGLHILKTPHINGRVLVVDELADTGATARLVRQALPDAVIAALFVKPLGRGSVDVFVAESPQDVWLAFPWETGSLDRTT